MDEDQVNEEQGNEPERQEVTFTEASDQSEGTAAEVFSAVRRDRVNLYSFLGKQNTDVNERITTLQRRISFTERNLQQSNTNFLTNINSINTALLTLEQGLKVVSDKLEVSAQLEKIRDANNLKREQQLAEQQLRAGKESLVEKRMQTALAAPLQKIGGKARSILGGLLKFFNTILLGIIGTRGIQVISALLSGNTEKIEEIKGKILKELGIASGIFLAINGGLAIALRSVIRLTAFIGRVAFTNLLARPLRRIFDLASRGAFLRGTTGGRTVVPPTTTVQRGKNRIEQTLTQSNVSRFRAPSLISGGISGFVRFLDTGSVPQSLTEGSLAAIFTRISLGIAKKNPYAQVGLTLLSVFGAQQITDAIFQPQQFSNVANQVQDRQLQLRNNNNVVVVEDETDETNIGGSLPVGDASSLLVLSSSNLDNPYLTNSYIQYNIML